MASFTDSIPSFNPYIQQLPIESMVKVGMEKQQRYDQGLQRIQSQIDQVAGLDIYRPEDKQLLQSKLNELGTKLKTVAAGDFSNYQLVNSVAGMAGTLMKDPTIIAAVQSTQNIKNNSKIMEEAREKGELTPDNELYYTKKLSAYENSGLVDERGKPIVFGAKYDPHFDVFKFVKENFDAVKPGNLTFEEVYETDKNGNPKIDPVTKEPIYSPVMIRLEKEGRLPEAVRETLGQIFSDPRVSKQLQITGEYNYQSYTPEMLKKKISNQETTILAAQNFQLAELTLIKTNAKTQEDKDKIDVQIGNIENSIKTITGQYKELKETADSNPDVIKGLLYEDDVRSRYTSMFGQVFVKQTNLANPGWDANYKIQQAAEQRRQFNLDMEFKERRAIIEDKKDAAALELEAAIASGKFSARGEWELSDKSAEFDKVAAFDNEYNGASEKFVDSSSEFIWSSIYGKIKGNDVRYQKLLDAGNTKEESINIILRQDAEKQGMDEIEFKTTWGQRGVSEINKMGGDVPDDLLMSYSAYNTARKNLDDLAAIKKQVDGVTASQTDKTILNILSGDEIKPQTIKYRGKDIQLSKQDVVDIGVYARGNKHIFGWAIDDGARDAAKSAEDRLRREGKGEVLDYVMRRAGMGDNDISSKVGGLFNIVEGVSKLARQIGQPIETLKDDWSDLVGDFTGEYDTKVDFSQFEKVFDGINNDQYSQALSTKAAILDKFYMVNPDLKKSLFTGNTESDRDLLSNVKRLSGAYGESEQNLSESFEDFASTVASITDPKDLNLEIESYSTGGGQVQYVISAYTTGLLGGEKVSMSIQPDEALRFGLANPYMSNSVAIVENKINALGGKTSYADPNDKSTYINGDAYFQRSTGDFPGLVNSPYNVMANITTSNGLYFGKIYVQDPATGRSINKVFTTPGSDIETVYNSLRSLDDNFIRALIPNK
jgi:hypothetical protein